MKLRNLDVSNRPATNDQFLLTSKLLPVQSVVAALVILLLEPAVHADAIQNGSKSNEDTPVRLSALDIPLRPGIEQSLSLDQAMTETLVQSPRAASLRLQLAIAKSALVRAKQLPNPTIFMDNGYKAEFTYRYGVSVPIEPPWKLALRVLAAKKQIQLADLEISKALWSLRGEIRRAYAEVLVARERLETLTELAELYQRLLVVAQKKYKAGDVAEVDVFRAELAHNQAEISRDQMSSNLTKFGQSMNVLLGRRHDYQLVVPRLPPFKLKAEQQDFLPDFEKSLPELPSLISRAKANRLEVKIVDQNISANEAKLRLSYGNIVPTPVLAAGSSVVNGPPNPGNQTNFHGFFLQGYAEIPIFNRQQGDISQYRMTIRQLRAESVTQQNIVDQDVVKAYRTVLALRQKIDAFQTKVLARSDQIAQLTRKSYEVGESDIASVLLAQQANVQVRNEYLDTVYAYEIAYTDLEQSIGTTLY